MSNTFVISDPHFGHGRILEFKRKDDTPLRPFATTEEMNEAMVENWNNTVRDQDKVYCLGDFAMKASAVREYAPRLRGTKILIPGNHDIALKPKEYFKYFNRVYALRVLSDMILTHIPLYEGSITKRYRVNVHGHLHANDIPNGKYFNVSVEQIGYTPISLEDLRKRILEKQEKYPPNYDINDRGDEL